MIVVAVDAEIPLLFAYGTLMEPRLLEGVLGHGLEGLRLVPATAPGYRTVHYPGRIYPALVASKGAAAVGLAVAGLSAADMEILDLFEGDEYVRRELDISLIKGKGFPDADLLFLAIEGALEKQKAQFYQPVVAMPEDAPEWSFAEWRRQHGEAMIVEEGETAATLRRQLIEMGGTDR